MLEIYSDKSLQNIVDNTTLCENVTYFARLMPHNPSAIKKELSSGQCAAFIDWHPNNQVGQITFKNIAGYVNLFGQDFNVKSTKLLGELSGDDQVKQLLKEISNYSTTLAFSPGAPAGFHYEINPKKLTGNTFYIYKFLSRNLFHDGNNSLQHLLEFILDNPHFNQRTNPTYTQTSTTRKFNHKTFQQMAGRIMGSDLIPQGHELYEKPFISKLPATKSGHRLLPKTLYSVTNSITYDTPENRFVKYFLQWCQEIFLAIYNSYAQYQIREDCAKSLRIIRKYLSHPFFRKVSHFSFLPTTSSVLTNRAGYKEIFLHYLKCRSQPKAFKEYLADMFDVIGIRDIATLYEYWVFFKIAKGLYGADAVLEVVGLLREGSNLKYNLKITNGRSTLYYNKTYKHSESDSYNFSLRPDISLEVNLKGEIKRFFFDAKYSNTNVPTIKEEPIVVYKNVNVLKMLSYLEAIKSSVFALIIYPGTKFSFYSKFYVKGKNHSTDPTMIFDYEGVGAIPLSPQHSESEEIFNSFMANFKNSINTI